MEYDLMINTQETDFAPSTIYREILQNAITICTTIKGTVPMDREFGVSPAIIDVPENISRARISAAYIEAVRKYEPRAEVVKVEFQGDFGEVYPVVKLRIREEMLT